MSKSSFAPGRTRSLLCGIALLTALFLAVSASAAQALPTRFWGAVPQDSLSQEQFYRVHRGGVQSIRIPIGWPSVQPSEGAAFDWSGVDAEVEKAARAGMEVLPFMVGIPTWAEKLITISGGNQVPAHLPTTGKARAGWLEFLREAVRRYGSSGTFWSEHPGVPRHPILNWQLWNEPNFKYFVYRPNPREYGQLVKISSAAIKGTDRHAKVILGGLFAWPRGGNAKQGNHNLFAKDFLEGMYRGVPGIASRFDGVALHPYSSNYRLLPRQIEEVRGVLARRHDSKTGIWLTELGWSSNPPASNNSFAKGPAGQARELKGAFSLLTRNQRRWRIQRVYWFSIDDDDLACNFCDGSGLFGPGFQPKPAWYAYVHFAGGRP